MEYPYRECPRFLKFSVNNCPLHPSFPEIFTDPQDFQIKCKMEKEVRTRIGSKYPDLLKYEGLTPREFAGKKRFESLIDQDKEIVRERARRAILSACEMEVPTYVYEFFIIETKILIKRITTIQFVVKDIFIRSPHDIIL